MSNFREIIYDLITCTECLLFVELLFNRIKLKRNVKLYFKIF